MTYNSSVDIGLDETPPYTDTATVNMLQPVYNAIHILNQQVNSADAASISFPAKVKVTAGTAFSAGSVVGLCTVRSQPHDYVSGKWYPGYSRYGVTGIALSDGKSDGLFTVGLGMGTVKVSSAAAGEVYACKKLGDGDGTLYKISGKNIPNGYVQMGVCISAGAILIIRSLPYEFDN